MWTIRLRLTALYGALFLAAGAVLLVVTYALAAGALPWQDARSPLGPQIRIRGVLPGAPGDPSTPEELLGESLAEQRDRQLADLLAASAVALGVMAVLSIALGWLMAGRVLRPLHTMTVTVRSISARDLHRRLDAGGPPDELKELADTFDGLLGDLQGAFEAQRRFVANASHELRTPLTYQRAVVEVALADPDASVEDLRAACERVLDGSRRQEQLIEALLTLARSERGLGRRAEFDLAEVAEPLLARCRAEASAGGRRVESVADSLNTAPVLGDEALVARLVANLLDNAVRHNVPGGRVAVATGVENGWSFVHVTNSGPVVQPDQVALLFEPFRRLDEARLSDREGLGVGLSIVAAVAAAHGAALGVVPRPEGGLDVRVAFAPSPVARAGVPHAVVV
ncbi:sensor histidine kinase [Streptodolium elevatio]|uniref:histidine kinase n=1 Tax=Streptodolium elevatio TaxID=3157996 RepID=A0ABV3DGL6_9ACTN